MTFQELLLDYNNQYPDDESPISYIAIFGEDEIMEFLKNRNGKRIGIVFLDNSDDGGKLVYL